jgi:hypothetical protein
MKGVAHNEENMDCIATNHGDGAGAAFLVLVSAAS